MGKQPGVMFYFDLRPCLERFTLEEQGALFQAILDYGELGLAPGFTGALGVAWDFIRPRLDRDRERYAEISEKRTQAVRSRWERARSGAARPGEDGPGREDAGDTNECKPLQAVPTTTSNPTTTTTPTQHSTATNTAAAPVEVCGSVENFYP